MHDRPIVGLTLFSGMQASAPGTWTGQIYNPEDGHTYAATLTMISRSEIKLRGCKAWLLCGEKQWLRTSAPPAAVPETAPEGTQQIEASATPAQPAPAAAVATAPAAAPKAEVAAASPAPAPKVEVAAVTPSMEAASDQAAIMTAAPAPTMQLPSILRRKPARRHRPNLRPSRSLLCRPHRKPVPAVLRKAMAS